MDATPQQQSSGTPDPNAAGSWMQAAADQASGAQGAQAGLALDKMQHPNSANQPQATTPTANGEIPMQPWDAPNQGNLIMTPKRGGLLGVLDKIADAFTGKTRPEIYTDQNGNEYVYHANLSRGQQWARIGAEAFRAAGAGLAAGKGAGNMGKAMVAGTDVAREAHQERQNEEQGMENKTQQDMLRRANNVMTQMQIAEQAWRVKRLDVQAAHEDAEFSQKMIQFFTDPKTGGGVVIGTAKDPGDIAGILGVNPSTMKDLIQRHVIQLVSTPTPDGHEGITAIKMPDDFRTRMLPAGTVFHTWDPVNHKMLTHNATDPMMAGEWANYEGLAGAARDKFYADQAEQQHKDAETENLKSQTEERNKLAPAKLAHEQAETFKARKEGEKAASETMGSGDNATMHELTTEQPVNGVRQNYLASLPDSDRALVQAIGEGRKEDVSSYALGRSPQARKIASEVLTAYPGYDFTRAPTYKKTREAFTSGKESQAINALNTAMEHMQQMYDNATWLTTTPLISAYQRAKGNQRAIDLKDAKTALVDELGKAYKAGALTIEDKKSWSDRINAWSPNETRGNAKSFVKLLRGKLHGYEQQWRQGAPPGAVAPIKILSPEAEAAWFHISAPPGATGMGQGTDGREHFVDAQGNDMGLAE